MNSKAEVVINIGLNPMRRFGMMWNPQCKQSALTCLATDHINLEHTIARFSMLVVGGNAGIVELQKEVSYS